MEDEHRLEDEKRRLKGTSSLLLELYHFRLDTLVLFSLQGKERKATC
jgi:hypothetical protein